MIARYIRILTFNVLVPAFLVSGLSTGAASAGAVPTPSIADSAAAPNEVSAKQIAMTYGHDVVVSSEQSSTAEVVAQSDGLFRLTENTEPVRVRRDGQWVSVNTALGLSAGMLRPIASAAPVAFSPGGADAPLAEIQAPSGQWVTQTWKLGALPAPQVSGATTTYADVLPDVDLQLSATPTGLSEVLVIKDAAAAANPDLNGLTFGVDAGDLVSDQVAGGTTLDKDAAGATQVIAPAPTWWDSSSVGASGAGPGGLGVPAPVPASATDSAVTIDAGTVAQAPNVTYPVYVDPDYKVGGVLDWAFVDSAYPDQAYWHDAGALDAYQHVGYVDGGDSDDGKDHTTSSYWSMNTSFLHGRLISDAVFDTTEVYSFSCSARSVQLWTTSAISPSTTSRHAPSKSSLVDTESVAYGYSSACPGHVVGFTATSAVQRAADASADSINLGLYAASTTDKYGWKKFDSSASLNVWFDTKPTTPAYRWVDGCAFICGSGAYTKYDTPTLYGASSDADGDNLSYNFNVYAGHAANPTNLVASGATPYVAPGPPAAGQQARGAWTPTVSLPDGEYEYEVRAFDGTAYSDWSGLLPFTVVNTRHPALPSLTASGPLSTSTGGSGGKVGQSLETVTITPAASSDDPVYAYSYGMFAGSNPTFASAGSCGVTHVGQYTFACGGLGSGVSVTVTATDAVSSFGVGVWDAAGNTPLGTGYASQEFWAGSDDTAGPAGNGHQWMTSSQATSSPPCTASSTVPDQPVASTPASAMTVAAGHACWGTSTVQSLNGPVGVMSFDGLASTVSTGAGANLVDTSKSFTAGTWVNITAGAPNVETFLDQEGSSESAFFLQFVKDAAGHGHFSFCMSNSDAATFAGDCVTAASTPLANTWYFVSAQWDAINHQMRLQVNADGSAATPVATYHASSWNATGSVRLGVDRIGTSRRYFSGMVCDPFIDGGILDSYGLTMAAQFGLSQGVPPPSSS